jgi:hypothetical protein
VQVQAYGPQQDVLDYRNIAGLLLSDDRVLEDRLQTTRLCRRAWMWAA